MRLFITGIFLLGACFGVVLLAIYVDWREGRIDEDVEWFRKIRERLDASNKD